MKKWLLIILTVGIFGVGGYFAFQHFSTKSDTPNTTTASQQSKQVQQEQDNFNKQQYSITDPTSIWIVVNKQHAIPIDYVPNLVVPNVKLRLAASEEQMHFSKQAEPALEEMFAAASKDKIALVFGSGYRSGTLQKQFYNSYKAKDGQAAADTYSARPGHSEHQTGLAVDLTSSNGNCHLQECWQDTPEGKWVAANAYRYGFILRYKKDAQEITGYQYEPWHYRYVGKELAAEIHKTGQTLEEFFNLGPANTYD